MLPLALPAPTPQTQAGGMQPPPPNAPGTIIGFPEPDEDPVNGFHAEPFQTNLQLSEARAQWLIDYALTRIREVSSEMGREPDGSVEPGSWMWIRWRNQATYDKNLEWRRVIGSIFEKSNFTLGDNHHYARLMAARVRTDLLGTRPYFAAVGRKTGNSKLAQEAEEYIQDKIDESNVTEAMREALRVALVRNDAVLKTTYLRDQTPYIGPATVMVDASGMPVLTPAKKLYVFQKDDFIPDPHVQGAFRLEKDPSFELTQALQFRYFPRLPHLLTRYDNVQSRVLEFRDFLCPLKFDRTDDADINVHLYETTPERLRADYPDIDIADRYFEWRSGWSGAKQPRFNKGEHEEEQSQVLSTVSIAECYLRVDADDSGTEQEIVLVLDLNAQKAVFYDYLGNHMSRRPFSTIIGVEKELGRWYGIGVFTKMEHNMLYTDTQFNRMNDKDSRNSSLTVRNANAITEWKAGGPVIFGSDQVLNRAPGSDPNAPVIERYNLQENAQLGLEGMSLMRQASAQEFGVIGSSTASANNFNQSKTAMGVMSVERDANVITQDTEIDIGRGLVDVLEMATELILSNAGEIELLYSKDGQLLSTLNRDEIRMLPRKVRLLLTKTRSGEMFQSNSQAEAIWTRYMQLSPPLQQVGRPLYVRQLKGLEVDDADELLPIVTKEEVDQWREAQSNAASNQKPVSKSIATRLTDLAPSERAQVLQQEGIQAAAPEELAQEEAQKLSAKVITKRAAHDRPDTAPEVQPAG